jgi:hypothetical protein
LKLGNDRYFMILVVASCTVMGRKCSYHPKLQPKL